MSALSVPVAAWMSSPVHTVTPATTVAEAVGLLRRERIRHLPVMEGDRVVGVVTDRDLRGVDPGVAVSTLMSRPVVVVSPRTAIDKAARLLFDRRIGCLPVIEDGKLVGILTQTDAVAAMVTLMRHQVGGRHTEVVIGHRPEAMALAHHAIRSLGMEVARLVGATIEPHGRGVRPERVRLRIETREMARVLDVLRAAGLTILSSSDGSPIASAAEPAGRADDRS
ncbi:MAG TPA: CBS domain-containing protein [Methylomirabilota bacterium]|jgi:acetoin utilization protein AcuB|nr:CBS domain-containing protein [Methylomirabilota bacterium]HEV8675210.1 CBS domain-containing protein [Methylomirabilota bacterium]